jgi:hypothetical protein
VGLPRRESTEYLLHVDGHGWRADRPASDIVGFTIVCGRGQNSSAAAETRGVVEYIIVGEPNNRAGQGLGGSTVAGEHVALQIHIASAIREHTHPGVLGNHGLADTRVPGRCVDPVGRTNYGHVMQGSIDRAGSDAYSSRASDEIRITHRQVRNAGDGHLNTVQGKPGNGAAVDHQCATRVHVDSAEARACPGDGQIAQDHYISSSSIDCDPVGSTNQDAGEVAITVERD